MKYLLLILTCLLSTLAFTQQPYWQQQVNFTIDVRLNDTAHSLEGFAKIEYINNSPDTLHFIWFHLWPNAYRSDKTAFSDQLLENGRTDFYFSNNASRGYINRLDFRIDGTGATMEDHPQHIDIVKVVLPAPLPPGGQILITTPFNVKLPYNFSRSGHIGQSYQVAQWFPKPAVYDRKGWHPMPYLDQGEFYSDFGNYDVRISVPEKYVVASTGELQQEERIIPNYKTLRYVQNQVHDFAWFADKDFIVKQDTLQLLSGRTVKLFNYYTKAEAGLWENAIQYMKDALHFRSRVIGEYPYNVASIVQGPPGSSGGMEYPTITLLRGLETAKELDFTIEHELGHNWFYGILATNERAFPWMDEGMNTYYDLRYLKEKYGSESLGLLESFTGKSVSKKFAEDESAFAIDMITAIKKDQPVYSASEEFTPYNYNVLAYLSAAKNLQRMESYSQKQRENDVQGTRATFDSAMKMYYEQWKFRHPYPEDFWNTMQAATNLNYSEFIEWGDTTETRSVFEKNRKPRLTAFFSTRDYKKYHYIALTPAIGINKYDKFMIGLGIHNYSLPLNRFRFALAPLYATNSKQLNGIGKVSYTWFPDKKIYSVQAGLSGSRFSSMAGTDSTGTKVFGGFFKAVPFVKLVFNNKRERNQQTWWIDARSYQAGEKGFRYLQYTVDSNYYPTETSYTSRFVNQLTIGIDNFRVLYPYDAQLQFQQAKDFFRVNLTGNYFFNYADGGGMRVRIFAAKFGYLGGRSPAKELDTYPFQPKLTAVRGDEDYTYSNYFLGRTETSGFASQQIMMRDGGLKLRTDLFQDLQGRSDNWVASINFSSSLPQKLLPGNPPLRLFLDIGSYADAWENNANTGKFLYVGGLQLSLFNDLINVYAPIVFSKEFRDNLKTIPEDYKFFKRLSFSIDIQKLNSRKIFSEAGIY